MSVASGKIEAPEYPDPLDIQVRMAARSRKKGRPFAAGKQRFIRAMRNTRGIKRLIADNLGIAYQTVANLLERPDWADVREAWLAEREKAIDTAEDTVLKAIEGDDPIPATTNARWLLSKLRPAQYGEKQTAVIEGGDKPLKILQGVVDLNALALPLEIKRHVLQALDAKEADERAARAGTTDSSPP
jgi:hypothetical protein